MLEVKNLTKTYKPKKGVPVKALDGVSLAFPSRGMVFLLGKSGSGKSTLLNLLGGLDTADSGEIIIKGESSANFKQKHFDSYRNTYVGFIFQEYNVIDEFSVGANIALSIELQGRKASDSEINDILRAVDLDGYGKRRPNELSGGQKQRVAIARALVKDPQIIMADEPTGALDVATGKQIFDTLKKLSADRLVIVVSHDREFAEKYADRIIELSDGKVISDVTSTEEMRNRTIIFDENTVTVSEDYRLTEEDRLKINDYIDKLQKGITLKIEKTSGRNFKKTEDVKTENDGEPFRLIKSKLPLSNAVKLGVSGLKSKKIRLAITILLSVVAFSLFGVADSMSAYNHYDTCAKSILDSNVTYAGFVKAKKYYYAENDYFYDRNSFYLTDGDIEKLKSDVCGDVRGVFLPVNMDFVDELDATEGINPEYRKVDSAFGGFVEADGEYLSSLGYSLCGGRLPNGSKNEFALSKYMASFFVYADCIGSEEEIIGKKFEFGDEEYEVVGIIDTGLSLEKYLELLKDDDDNLIDEITRYAFLEEFRYSKTYGLSDVAFVGNGFINSFFSDYASETVIDADVRIKISGNEFYPGVLAFSDAEKDSIKWVGEPRDVLAEDEIVVSEDLIDGNSGAAISKNNEVTVVIRQNFGVFSSEEKVMKVVGVVSDGLYSAYFSDGFYNSSFAVDRGKYVYAVGSMPKDFDDVRNIVEYCDLTTADAPEAYSLENAVISQTSGLNEGMKVLAKIFLFIGIGFALFASLLLANFIGISISIKKREIGILRAIGARGSDVFGIFFSESFVIAMINFVLSVLGTFAATAVINSLIRKSTFLLISVLSFGIRQAILLLCVSIVTAFVSSYIPVKKTASKKPIDAIRNR